jgi:pyrimidine oxygenase
VGDRPSDLKGDFFQMDDCRCLPTPTGKIPIICAAQSDAGTRFAARYGGASARAIACPKYQGRE